MELAKLTDYEIIGDGEEKDAHLFCKVRIKVHKLTPEWEGAQQK